MQVSMNERIIVTGATGAMGSVVCEAMARQGRPVLMACRNAEAAERTRKNILGRVPGADIEIDTLRLDSLSEIRAFAKRHETESFAGLFNNAGTMQRYETFTEDGFETVFGVNYLGTWLLTNLLLPHISPEGRIVTMVSLSARYSSAKAVFSEFLKSSEGASKRTAARLETAGQLSLEQTAVNQNFVAVDTGGQNRFKPSAECLAMAPEYSKRKYSQLGNYALSKRALIYFCVALSRRTGIKVNMADPGIVNTNMIRMDRWFDPLTDLIFRPICYSPEKGARPAVNALGSDQSCRYFSGTGNAPVHERYLDDKVIDLLWDETSRLLGMK